jgi:hypothetical protein
MQITYYHCVLDAIKYPNVNGITDLTLKIQFLYDITLHHSVIDYRRFGEKLVPSAPNVLRYGILDHTVLKTSNLTDLKLCVSTAHILTMKICKTPSVNRYRRKSQNPFTVTAIQENNRHLFCGSRGCNE